MLQIKEWENPYNPFNSMKCLVWREQIEGIISGKFTAPVIAEIDCTNVCNHRCSHCINVNYRKENLNTLEPAVLLELINILYYWGVKAVVFIGGGEPLINKGTLDAMEMAHSLGIPTALVSNGGMLDDRAIDVIGRCCEWAGFSIDAATNETHKALHGPVGGADFNTIIEMIEKLNRTKPNKKKPQIGYKFLIHPLNAHETLAAAKLAKKIGCNDFHCRPVYLKEDAAVKEAVVVAYEQIQQAMSLNTKDFHVIGSFAKFHDYWSKGSKRNYLKCRATPLIGLFGADGNIHLCCDRRGEKGMVLGPFYKKVGNGYVFTLKDIWGSEKHKKLIEEIKLSECPRCRYTKYNEVIEHVFINDEMDLPFL